MSRSGRIFPFLLAMTLIPPAPAQSPVAKHDVRIESLKFESIQRVRSELRSNFQTVYDIGQLVLAFQQGSPVIAKYREPVLTRGARGIALFRQASPGVVLIAVGRVENGHFNPSGLGTGAIVDQRGYVITNWHVVKGFQRALAFLKPLGAAEPTDDRAVVVQVIAQDAIKDLALLRIIEPPSGLTVLPLAAPSSVEVAEDVHVIGHPHGNFWSYSTGVVSQYRPAFTWSYADGSHHRANVLQMQTAINPGNSGGPVLNDSGQMVGLVAMSEDGQNLNYAISLDELRQFLTANLPVRTRAVQNIVPVETQFSFSEAISPALQRVTRGKANDVEIFIIEEGPHWHAVVTGPSNEFQVQRSNKLERWSVILDDGKTIVIEFSRGAPARIANS